MALLSLETIRDGIRSNPSLYPQNLDLARQGVLILQLDEAAFRAASFLDDRILSPQLQGRWVPFAEIEPWLLPPASPRPLHFIFHTGHVGSTLVSRLLDDVGAVLGVREPLPLRTLAMALGDIDAAHALVGPAQWKALLNFHLACWGRGYADTQSVIVKATSSAGQCCQPILDALPEARALLLNLQPEPYLATLLAGPNSYLDLRGQAQDRAKRLFAVAPSQARPLHTLSLGEIAAMTWTVETLVHRDVERRFGSRTMRVDFDAFLEAPDVALREICGHLRLAAPDSSFAHVATSPTLTRYSKAPELDYTPDLRREVLAESRVRNAEEIRNGMRWIETFARQHPDLASTLSA
jgi:hypothetical protein